MQEANIIDSIRSFILTCPFLDNYRVNVDHLSEDMSYSVDPLPCDPVLQKYVDGGKKKQFQFAFTSKEQTDKGEMPELKNEKQQPYELQTLNSGYLYDAEGEYAQYRIECRLLYIQEV